MIIGIYIQAYHGVLDILGIHGIIHIIIVRGIHIGQVAGIIIHGVGLGVGLIHIIIHTMDLITTIIIHHITITIIVV